MKLLLVCSNGGHFSTLSGLKKFWSKHSRHWVTHKSPDTLSLKETELVHWVFKQNSRSVVRTVINFIQAFFIIRRIKPDLVISTGAAVGVSFLLASRILGIKTVYIESISRVESLSLTGRVLYPIVDDVYVQWEKCLEKYPRAKYHGMVV